MSDYILTSIRFHVSVYYCFLSKKISGKHASSPTKFLNSHQEQLLLKRPISNRNKCENVIAKVMIICNNNRRNKKLDASITVVFDAECPF